jgi:hypothetical protein
VQKNEAPHRGCARPVCLNGIYVTKMKTFRTLFIAGIILATVSALTSCSRALGIHGEGSPVTEQRSPGVFNAVALNIDADVVLHSDSLYRIEVTGQRNILDVLTTRVENNELVIDFSECVSNYSALTIHVYAPVYVGVSICGSGSISNADSLVAGNMRIKLAGSGSISLGNIRATSVTSSISGSGNITLGGNSQLFTSEISGSGKMKAFSLQTQTAQVNNSGSGDSEVSATQTLGVNISGSGDVYYRGTPALTVSISGSGRVIHVN